MQKPKVFANPINKKINNSREVFYEGKEERINKDINVLKKIDDIFRSTNHVYKSHVIITTNNGDIICDVVGKTNNSLLTLDGKTINISNILDIKKI